MIYFLAMLIWPGPAAVWNLEPTWARLVVILGWPAVMGLAVLLLRARSAALKDTGFLLSEQGQPRLWARVPITPVAALDLSTRWRLAFVGAIDHWNAVIGFRVFWPLQTALPDLRMDRPGSGMVKIRDDNGMDPDHGFTLFYPAEPPTSAALVTVPEQPEDAEDEALDDETRWAVAVHELGHVLGLAHDGLSDSIMFPALQERPQYATERDIQRIRRTYKSRQ